MQATICGCLSRRLRFKWPCLPLGDVYSEIRVPALRWPDSAYESLHHTREPEAAEALKEAIEEAERRSTSEPTGR